MSKPSNSHFVCWRDGLPVHGQGGGWRHALGGGTGAIPRSRKHYPVPVARTLYKEAFSITVTPERFREIKAGADALDKKLQAEHPQRGRKR